MAACWLALAALWAVRFLRARPGLVDWLAAAALLAVPALLLAASAWHSWTDDYQPQGRYLFPSNVAWAALGALVPLRRRADGSAAAALPAPGAACRTVASVLWLLGLVGFLLWAASPLCGPAAALPPAG